jgi:hypothetical protein
VQRVENKLNNVQRQDYEYKLKNLTERKRRTFLRNLDRGLVTELDLLSMKVDDAECNGFWDSDDEDEDEDSDGESENDELGSENENQNDDAGH